MNTKEDYIGVIDSGVGGISVLRHLRRVMPEEKFYYFGDSANAPYGIRTKPEVQRLTFAAVDRLMGHGLKALVPGFPEEKRKKMGKFSLPFFRFWTIV